MLNRHNFEIAELASTEEDRLVMCGIHVTPEGTSVTNGHQAVVVSSAASTQPTLFAEMEDVEPADFFTPFILDRESALKIAKAIPKKTENLDATYAIVDATTENNDRAMVSVNDIYRQEILRARKISGTFPDVATAFPDKEKAKFILRMDPELLIAVLKTVQKFCKGHGTRGIELRLFGAGQPLRIDVEGIGQTLSGVIMPLRGDEVV